jgi:hypothetical protein
LRNLSSIKNRHFNQHRCLKPVLNQAAFEGKIRAFARRSKKVTALYSPLNQKYPSPVVHFTSALDSIVQKIPTLRILGKS